MSSFCRQLVLPILVLIIPGGFMATIMEAQKTEKQSTEGFHSLVAAGRSPEIPEANDVYGWLVGSWDLDVYRYGVNVEAKHIKGEIHFAWVMEGRAIQDVWIMPRRSDRTAETSKMLNMYGTTLRVWDASIPAWRVTWINPVTGGRDELIGRRDGRDIVQIGTHANGTPIRWMFTEITPDSFRWTGEVLETDGKTWRLEGEFRARRVK
jgi:hypothetical protein